MGAGATVPKVSSSQGSALHNPMPKLQHVFLNSRLSRCMQVRLQPTLLTPVARDSWPPHPWQPSQGSRRLLSPIAGYLGARLPLGRYPKSFGFGGIEAWSCSFEAYLNKLATVCPPPGCSPGPLGCVHPVSAQQWLWRDCQILCIGNSVFKWTPYFLAVYGCITCIFIYSVFMLSKCSIL